MSNMSTCRDCSAPIQWHSQGQNMRAMEADGKAVHRCPTEIKDKRNKLCAQLIAIDSNKWNMRELGKRSIVQLEAELIKIKVTPEVDISAPATASTEPSKWDTMLAEIVARVPGEHKHQNYGLTTQLFELNPTANQWWKGEAGGGKTFLAKQIARALALGPLKVAPEAVVVSMTNGLTLERFAGYRNIINGEWIPGELHERIDEMLAKYGEHARLLIVFDECDRLDPGLAVWLNAALEQRTVWFGPKEYDLKRHLFVATGNSGGIPDGGEYTAVMHQDGAFLSRFPVKITHNYDPEHEVAISADKHFTRLVQKVRKVAADAHFEVSSRLTPRVSIQGGLLIKGGAPRPLVEELLIWNALPPDIVPPIRQQMGK